MEGLFRASSVVGKRQNVTICGGSCRRISTRTFSCAVRLMGVECVSMVGKKKPSVKAGLRGFLSKDERVIASRVSNCTRHCLMRTSCCLFEAGTSFLNRFVVGSRLVWVSWNHPSRTWWYSILPFQDLACRG